MLVSPGRITSRWWPASFPFSSASARTDPVALLLANRVISCSVFRSWVSSPVAVKEPAYSTSANRRATDRLCSSSQSIPPLTKTGKETGALSSSGIIAVKPSSPPSCHSSCPGRVAGRTQPSPAGACIDAAALAGPASLSGCRVGCANVAASQGNSRSLPGNATGRTSTPCRSCGIGPSSVGPPAGTALPVIRTGRGTGSSVAVRPPGMVKTAVPSPVTRRCSGVRVAACIADHSWMPRCGAFSSRLFSTAFGVHERYISTWNQTGQV